MENSLYGEQYYKRAVTQKEVDCCHSGNQVEKSFIREVCLPIEFYSMTTLNRLVKEWNLRVDKEREERARSTLWIA